MDDSEQAELYYRCSVLGQDLEEALSDLGNDGVIYEATVKDYAYEYIADSGVLDSLPEQLQGYFDYDMLARDLEMSGSVYEFRYSDSTYTAMGF